MAVPIRPPANSELNDRAPQMRQETSQATSEAMPHDALLDHYSVLLKTIADASADPAQLRKLVYTMACHDIRPDDALAQPIPDATKRARTIVELEQALQLERAIKRLESQSAQLPGARDADAPQAVFSAPPDVAYSGAIADAAPREMLAEAPLQAPYALRLGFKSSLKLGAATASGIALFLGVAAWLHLVRPEATSRASQPQVATSELPASEALKTQTLKQAELPAAAETGGSARSRLIEPAPAARSGLPFPLPVRPGVYAASSGRLAELEPLPVDVPPPRARLSAEIAKPSATTVSGDRLTFVAFRPNAAHSAATVSAHVVARVSRAVTFVNLKVRVTPLPSSWRIRDISYEFKAAPLEGNRDMIVIQPDRALPAGRYALVLDGRAYDFAVAGPITAPEQCLEQTQVVNGVVIAECPGS
jgi:hypothetical protein